MTQNQISYWTLQEQKRSNLAKEEETKRSNVAKEGETQRHNVEDEKTKRTNMIWSNINDSVDSVAGVLKPIAQGMGELGALKFAASLFA